MTTRAPEHDLVWLFNCAESAVSGLGSQLSGLIDLAQTGACRAVAGSGGIPKKVQGITGRQAAAVGRERWLLERLQRVPQGQRDVLYLAFGPQEWGLHAVKRKQKRGSGRRRHPAAPAELPARREGCHGRQGLVGEGEELLKTSKDK